MTKQLPAVETESTAINKLILTGDISKLNDDQQIAYYKGFCERVGLDWATRPLDYLVLQGRKVLYLNKGGAEQLNKLNQISHSITDSKTVGDMYIVTARASNPAGRFEESTGVVSINGLRGDMLANALMKAETKAKRRATLALVGLGILDETEIETVQGNVVDVITGEVVRSKPPDVSELGSALSEPATTDYVAELRLLCGSLHIPDKFLNVYLKKNHAAGVVDQAAFISANDDLVKVGEHLDAELGADYSTGKVTEEAIKKAFRAMQDAKAEAVAS